MRRVSFDLREDRNFLLSLAGGDPCSSHSYSVDLNPGIPLPHLDSILFGTLLTPSLVHGNLTPPAQISREARARLAPFGPREHWRKGPFRGASRPELTAIVERSARGVMPNDLRPTDPRAFSREVDTGSREENASRQRDRAFSREVGTGSREENASKQRDRASPRFGAARKCSSRAQAP